MVLGMRTLITIALATVSFCTSGCSGLSRQRGALCQQVADTSLTLSERVEAFDALLDTFAVGTSEATARRYVRFVTRSRISDGEVFSAHLIAPDGTDRWLTIVEGRVWFPKN